MVKNFAPQAVRFKTILPALLADALSNSYVENRFQSSRHFIAELKKSGIIYSSPLDADNPAPNPFSKSRAPPATKDA